jgi:hypothetical protein
MLKRSVLALTALVAVLAGLAGLAPAQDFPPSPAPNSTPITAPAFWTHQAKADYALLAGFEAVDATATLYLLSCGGREVNPIVRPLVTRGAGGQAAVDAIGFGAVLGISYALHRAGHPRAAVIARRISVAVESGFAGFTFVNSQRSTQQCQH